VSGGQISGRTNIKNTKLYLAREDDKWHTGKCTAFLGDGTKRYYSKDSLLIREERPSGNIVHYTYDKDERITRIYATDPTNQITLSWMNFSYNDKKHTIDVIASNGKLGTYKLEKHKKNKFDKEHTLNSYSATGTPKCTFEYTSTNKNRVLNKILWESGEFIDVDYHHNKVETIYFPGNGDKSIKLYEINYHHGNYNTTVKDLYDGKTIYTYTDKFRLETKERYHKGNFYSRQEYYWGGHHKSGDPGKPLRDDEGYLLTKGIADSKKDLFSVTTYTYDSFGNVLSETIAGNLSGNEFKKPFKIKNKRPVLTGHEFYTRYFTYSDDGLNLLTSMREDDGTLMVIKYLPNTDKIIRRLTYAGESIISREFFEYNNLSILTKKIVDDGITEEVGNLYGVNQRIITIIQPNMIPGSEGFGKPVSVIENYWDSEKGIELRLKRIDYTYGQYDLVTSEFHYDAEDQFRYNHTYKYDSSGNLIEEVDPLGRSTQFRYNEAQLCNYKELLGSGVSTSYVYDKRGRLIKTLEHHHSGETFIKSLEYDHFNRKIADIDHLGILLLMNMMILEDSLRSYTLLVRL
jgi:YD repeat-containing protein